MGFKRTCTGSGKPPLPPGHGRGSGKPPLPPGHRRGVATATPPPANQDADDGTCVHWEGGILDPRPILKELKSYLGALIYCQECRMSHRSGKFGQLSLRKIIVWVCLHCNKRLCGGHTGSPSPRGHMATHAKKKQHWLAIRPGNPLVSWCFACGSFVMVDMLVHLPRRSKQGRKPEIKPEIDLQLLSAPVPVVPEVCPIRGLTNLGNTCYFNAVMQSLISLRPLWNCLVSLQSPGEGSLTTMLQDFLIEMADMEELRDAFGPTALFGCFCHKVPQFRGNQMQDSHEFLHSFLSVLRKEATEATQKLSSSPDKQNQLLSENASVDAFFKGMLRSTISCVRCGNASVVYEVFLDISLSIPCQTTPPKKVSWRKPSSSKDDAQKSTGEEVSTKISHSKSHETATWGTEEKLEEVYGQTSDWEFPETAFWETEEYGSPDVYHEPTVFLIDSVSQNTKNIPILPFKEAGFEAGKLSETTPCSKNLINVAIAEDPVKKPSLPFSLDKLDLGSEYFINEANSTIKKVADTFKDNYRAPGIEDSSKTNQDNQDVEDGTGSPISPESSAPGIEDSSKTNQDNQDVEDGIGSPISLENCLDLYTKPEYLPCDHEWRCEKCSEMSPSESQGRRKIARLDESETLKSQLDGVQVKGEEDSSSLQADCVNSAECEVIGDSKMAATTPKDFVLHSVNADDPNKEAGAPTTPPKLVREAFDNTEKGMGSSDHKICDDQAHCTDVLNKNEFADFEKAQYTSCPSSHEKFPLQESLDKQDGDAFTVNDRHAVECSGQNLEVDSTGSPDQTEAILHGSCDNDNLNVKLVEIKHHVEAKKGLQLMNTEHLAENSKGKKTNVKKRKVKGSATKRILISKAPSILTIHLKRFFQDDHYQLHKITAHVHFQETLNLAPYTDLGSGEEISQYRLMAVVEHMGSFHGGHYVAYVRRQKSGSKAENGGESTWYRASDGEVREASLSDVLMSQAYILFYVRVDLKN